MTAKRFICIGAIVFFASFALGIYGYVRASEDPDAYKQATRIEWVLPPSSSWDIERNGELFFVTKGALISVVTVKDGKPQWRAEGNLQYGGKKMVIYREDENYGYMDLDGKVLIKARFGSAEAFRGDYALVRNKERTASMIIDRQGKELYTFDEDQMVMWAGENLLAIYNEGDQEPSSFLDCRSGKHVRHDQNLHPLGEGLYAKWIEEKADESVFVVCDEKGEVMLNGERFRKIDDFDQGVAYVKKESGKQGYMNAGGEMVYPLQDGFKAGKFQDGKGIVDTGKDILIVNTKGKVITKLPKNGVLSGGYTAFSEGLAPICVKKAGRKRPEGWGYIDETGTFVIPPIFSHTEPIYQGCAVVRYGNGVGIIKVK